MNNVNVKKSLILTLSLLSFNVSATVLNRIVLAQQCHNLSENVGILIASQAKNACVEKLAAASRLIEKSGHLILEEANLIAKQELDIAINALQYAELYNCNKYIQISHSKVEAHKIKNML